jgi:hypothetical protein
VLFDEYPLRHPFLSTTRLASVREGHVWRSRALKGGGVVDLAVHARDAVGCAGRITVDSDDGRLSAMDAISIMSGGSLDGVGGVEASHEIGGVGIGMAMGMGSAFSSTAESASIPISSATI